MSQEKSDTAPATASAGIVPTQGDQGVTSVIDSSLRVAQPANNARELAEHTGVINRLDDYFYTHFIRFTSFSWTTSQLTGHVLYSLPLTPYNLSSPLSYVMALYNQWAGGFQIRIEVAGTGFNGGKLMFVRFPPNINPDNYDINSATVFPYIMLDPKSQVSGVLDIEDYRQGLFHWNQRFADPYGKIQNTIGTFRVFVMLPLISSSLTTASISIQLSARLSPSFAVSQLIPPQLSETVVPVKEYGEPFVGMSDYLTFARTLAIRNIIVVPSTSSTLATEMCVDFQHVHHVLSPIFATLYQTVPGDPVNLRLKQTGMCQKENDWYTWNVPIVNYWDKSVNFTENEPAGKWAVCFGNFTEPLSEPAPENERTRIVAPNGESLVLFAGKDNTWGVPTFDQLRYVTARGLFQDLEDDESIVYQIIDRTTRTPLLFLRLCPGGYFSTTTVSGIVRLNVGDIDVAFYSKLPVTTALPVASVLSQMRMEAIRLADLTRRIQELQIGFDDASDRDSSLTA
nr:MAG: capsid protein [Wenzhou bat picorna-like virus 4]